MAKQQLPPAIVSVHVPKCAGTTVRLYFERVFGERHKNLYVDQNDFVYSEEQLWAQALSNPSVVSISSHFIRRYPAALNGRRLHYFTFLRDPVEHFLSYYSYMKKVYTRIKCPLLLRSLPPDCDQICSRDFATWLLDSPYDVHFRENCQTNYFARYTWMALTGRGPAATDPWPNLWNAADWNDYRAARLEIAQQVLRSFVFVGVSEKLQDGIETLRERMRPHGFDLPAETLGIENVSREFRDDTSWIRADDAIGAKLLASLREDYVLYESYRSRYPAIGGQPFTPKNIAA